MTFATFAEFGSDQLFALSRQQVLPGEPTATAFHLYLDRRQLQAVNMQAQKIAVGPPQSQEMSAQLLVANSSNFPSGSVPVRSPD